MRDDVVLVGVAHAVGVDHEALERAHLLGDGAPLEAEHHGGGSAAAVDGGTGPIAHLVARALPNAAGDVLHPGDDRLLHLLVRAEVARAHDDALRAVVLRDGAVGILADDAHHAPAVFRELLGHGAEVHVDAHILAVEEQVLAHILLRVRRRAAAIGAVEELVRAGELAVDALGVGVPVLHDGREVVAADLARRRHVVDHPVHGLFGPVRMEHPLGPVDAVAVIAHHALEDAADVELLLVVVRRGAHAGGVVVALLVHEPGVDGEGGAAAADDLVEALDEAYAGAALGGGEGAVEAREAGAHDNDVVVGGPVGRHGVGRDEEPGRLPAVGCGRLLGLGAGEADPHERAHRRTGGRANHERAPVDCFLHVFTPFVCAQASLPRPRHFGRSRAAGTCCQNCAPVPRSRRLTRH